MLLELAKEIYDWCLVAKDIILLARKNIYTQFMVSESIYVKRGFVQRYLEISNKIESFPSYGSRIFFSLFLRPYYIFKYPS